MALPEGIRATAGPVLGTALIMTAASSRGDPGAKSVNMGAS